MAATNNETPEGRVAAAMAGSAVSEGSKEAREALQVGPAVSTLLMLDQMASSDVLEEVDSRVCSNRVVF